MKKALILVVVIVFLFGGGYSIFANTGVHADRCTGPPVAYCTELNNDPTTTILPPENTTCICNPLQSKNFTDIIDNILNFLFNIALVLSPIMVVIAGVMFVTAGGSPDRISTAKRILLWTAVGFVIIVLARGLITVLQTIIGF